MPRWYYWVLTFFLLDTMEAFGFLDRMIYGDWDGKAGDKITQTLNLLMIVSSLILFTVGLRRGHGGIEPGGWLALSATGFLCLSAFWSLNPATTVRTGMIYVSVVLGVIGIARTLNPDKLMHLLSWCAFVSAIASVVLIVIAPRVAFVVGDNSGAFNYNGIFPHKNFLGQVMATGALATLHGIRSRSRPVSGQAVHVGGFPNDGLRLGIHWSPPGGGAFLRCQRD